jgi:hemerythrin-like metal-binding protein
MEKIIWTKEWCLDNGEMDKQHKLLIDTLNRIVDHDININELILTLIEYASNHFVDEEVLMLKNSYPEKDYLYHKGEHRTFTRALLEVSFGLAKVENSEIFDKVIERLQSFCFTWFDFHFLNLDKDVMMFLQKGGGVENIECS